MTQMTLHEAMTTILREHDGWMSRDALAREIAARDLYRQRAGGPAPSSQLALRARKYNHLFEGSDPSFTRIRLTPRTHVQRPSPATTPASQAPGAAQAAKRGRPRVASGAERQPLSAEAAARQRRARAAQNYRPEHVDLLLVAEAPPGALDRYFYFDDVRDQDSLFRYVARSMLGVEPTRAGKAALLGQLRDRGVFLIDVSVDPIGDMPLTASVPDLVERVRALAPQRIVLIKATVYDAAFVALRGAGLPVIDERVPFPGSGQQRRFEAAFGRALSKPPAG